ncbi:hypothetical protein TVAG_324210 [Trichomonas vaginalis G3]|uniref:Uncharacterized protein n=1 Tax=Trichomonas vaginalis (strain ATCC PRA-98 / G3) TaxID=412133 RepID=A2FT89_TRIV3|nr:hypothetical protein TVAG_324210 [Trichomonas vaginalis G3]|eukprot:XP_001304803.1 hypothetical protein [Trichomonas vaginalis G3]
MLFLFFLYMLALSDSTNSSTTDTCPTGTCNVLMIVFGCIGALLLIAFIAVVIRYNCKSQEEQRQISTTLVD